MPICKRTGTNYLPKSARQIVACKRTLTRLFGSFPNHDTTLTVILNLHFGNINTVMLEPKMEKTVYTDKNEGKNRDTEVSEL